MYILKLIKINVKKNYYLYLTKYKCKTVITISEKYDQNDVEKNITMILIIKKNV